MARKAIIFITLSLLSGYVVAENCIYITKNSTQNTKCDINRVEVGAHFFVDNVYLNGRKVTLHAAQVTPEYTGEEIATISENGETIDAEYVIKGDYVCFYTNKEAICEKNSVRDVVADNRNIYYEGTYKVGIDIPEGEYKLIETDSDFGGFYRVYLNSGDKLDSIVTGGSFKRMTYVTVKKGQYLELSRCNAEKVN